MPRMDKLSNYRTTVTCTKGRISVVYVATLIVDVDPDGNVTLDSGGWQTVTTKRKMCQAARQFGLDYAVFQRKGDWFVDVWSDALKAYLGLNMPFHDGMTFNPRQLRMRHNAELALA